MTHSQMDAELAALYARIPRIPDCDGRCWRSCGPIDMSDRERQRIRRAGFRITPWQDARAWEDTFYCEALTGDKQCAVYEMRPLVCRLWGTVEGMKCPFGCVPEGGWLPDTFAHDMIVESMRIGGHPRMLGMPGRDEARRVMRSPQYLAEMAQSMEVGQAGELLRIEESIPVAFRRKRGDT